MHWDSWRLFNPQRLPLKTEAADTQAGVCLLQEELQKSFKSEMVQKGKLNLFPAIGCELGSQGDLEIIETLDVQHERTANT